MTTRVSAAATWDRRPRTSSAWVAKPGVLPAGVSLERGGLVAQQQEAFRGLAAVFAAALAIVTVLLLLL